MQNFFRVICFMVLAGIVTACSKTPDGEPDLVRYQSSGAPDEFAVTVYKPIQIPNKPDSLLSPGQQYTNRSETNPKATALAVLGGRAVSSVDNNVPNSDASLVSYVTRNGVKQNIRQVLNQEDIQYRQENKGRLFERWFGSSIYYGAYEDMMLDPYAESTRLADLGYKITMPQPQE